ncbi:hypothetical protein OIV83_004913 [Microbotryomycetes sp. JL201]|nr:hypothetical protein OIV83_004913 [Microbotryomycetes sp. JL201]
MVTKRVSIAAQGSYAHGYGVGHGDQPHHPTSAAAHDDEQTATSTQVSPLAARRISMRIPGLPATSSTNAITSPTRASGLQQQQQQQQLQHPSTSTNPSNGSHYHSKSYYGLPERSMSMSVMSRYNSTPPSWTQKLRQAVDSPVWVSKRLTASPVKRVVVLVVAGCLVLLVVTRLTFGPRSTTKSSTLSEDEIVDQVLKQAASMGTYTLDNAHVATASITANKFEKARPAQPPPVPPKQAAPNRIVNGGGAGFRKMAKQDDLRQGVSGKFGKGNKKLQELIEEEDEPDDEDEVEAEGLASVDDESGEDEAADASDRAPKRPEIHHPEAGLSVEEGGAPVPGGRRKPAGAAAGAGNREFRLKDSDDIEDPTALEMHGLDSNRGPRRGKQLKGEVDAPARGGGKRPKQLGRPKKQPEPPSAGNQADDEWNDAGWHQRFKPKGPGGAALVEGGKAQPVEVPSLLAKFLGHPLVSRYASLDLGVAAKHAEAPMSPSQKFNMTVCAILPGESRFLQEWIIYHRLLGVDRIVLYDTTARGAQGAAEVEALVGKLSQEQIVGNAVNNAEQQKQVAEDIKARVEGGGTHALDKVGKIEVDRIAGLERWLMTGSVIFNHLSFRNAKKAKSFNEHFLKHCTEEYSSTTEWLAQLDVDEFLTMSEPLYGPSAPYQDGARAYSASSFPPVNSNPWRYPLHDLMSRDHVSDAACIVVPQLRYRNWGRRQLTPQDSVVDIQTRRDVLTHETLPAKAFLHTHYSKDVVTFDGQKATSCEVTALPKELSEGMTDAIKTSQGLILQEGGTYKESRLPTEPLAVAHYVQRDLADCVSKLGTVDDPNSVREKSRGVVSCEQQYLPSPEEMSSETWLSDKGNRFLAKTPPEGTIVDDPRVRDSWTAKATKAVLFKWKKPAPVDTKMVQEARNLVKIVYI